jgi:hypothetical protein
MRGALGAWNVKVAVRGDRLVRPVAALDLRPMATLDLRAVAALDLRPAAALDLRPAATLDLRPAATLDLRPVATRAAPATRLAGSLPPAGPETLRG